jgi:aspartyl aminopeptidase
MAASTVRAMMDFLWAGSSPYHCVAEVAGRLEAAGFLPIDEGAAPAAVSPGDGGFIARGGTIVAWRGGTRSPAEAGFRIVGAHTDSPNLRLKPLPDADHEGYARLGVEVYGGALWHTWLDRDLGISGRVAVEEDGAVRERLFRTDDVVARIPNLAIHLSRGVNTDGLKLDPQKHLVPVWGMARGGRTFSRWLSDALGGAAVLGWDLMLHDLQPPALAGAEKEFVLSARLDNQASCFQALEAFLGVAPAEATQVLALFDHEEIGSRSRTGAMGPFLRDVLSRLVRDHVEQAPGGLERAAANSFQVSVDMAHGVHPNFADLHEPKHKPMLNGGPVIKTQTEQRYATDGVTMARFRRACAAAEVPCQDYVVRTDLPCGSTIGPISAAELGIATVDVGCPMWSMHSIREQCGADDAPRMIRALAGLLAD